MTLKIVIGGNENRIKERKSEENHEVRVSGCTGATPGTQGQGSCLQNNKRWPDLGGVLPLKS